MAHDLGERFGRAATKELEVPARDLPALDVVRPADPEELLLGSLEPSVRHAVTEDAAHDREEVEVSGVGRRGAPGNAEGHQSHAPRHIVWLT